MKQFRFVFMPLIVTILFFLTSCTGDDSKGPTGTDSTIVDTSTNGVTTETSTIITTPQNIMIATHKVSDFAKWKASYDEHDSMRLANGIHSFVIGRGLQDSNMVFVVVKADDMEKAKAFAKDPSLKRAMQKGGVIGAPTISFATITWQDTAVISSSIRSRTTFTVKDWDAWQKNFADSKQERINNGITDRAYGHDADDNKKVTLVTALADTAKAFAYYKSDELKKRREASGVIGEPKRFLFRVVQRY
ncbi:MAG: DUF3764 family protein [Chitinophagaceae bacterium]